MADKKTGYGRRWKKWPAIYAVAGVVVYLIVYLVFFYHAGGGAGRIPGARGVAVVGSCRTSRCWPASGRAIPMQPCGTVAAWLLTIARNVSIDMLATRRFDPIDPEDILAETARTAEGVR
jgi:hypothetical protein